MQIGISAAEFVMTLTAKAFVNDVPLNVVSRFTI